jgi:hypothetical protein
MKFEIKTEPVCAVLIAVPALRGHRRRRYRNDAWFPLAVIVVVLAIGMNYISK